MKNSILFILFNSFPLRITQILYGVWKCYAYQMTALPMESFMGAKTGQLWPGYCLLDTLQYHSDTCMASQAIIVWARHVCSGHTRTIDPCVTGLDEFARN